MAKKKKEEDVVQDIIEISPEQTMGDIKRRLMQVSTGTIVTDELNDDFIPLETPAYGLNRILSGSLFKAVYSGTHTGLVGPEACLDEDTNISYERWSKSTGKRLTHKKIKIKDLYKRFHNIQKNVHEYHKFKDLDDMIYYVKSINEEDRIIRNFIVDVLKTGKKECYKLTTIDGFEIITSKDHKFYIGNGNYLELENLKENDVVYVHTNKRFEKKVPEYKNGHKYVNVKFHPNGKRKIKNNYEYYYIRRSQLVYEAFLNNIEVDEYRDFLNKKSKDEILKLNFVDPSKHLHHINKNDTDDRIENLELLDEKDHLKFHADESHNNLRFVAYETKIKSIVSVGERETYDIKCLSPYNNYVANNFITHNSGKSSVMAILLADAQRKGYLPVVIDAEGAWTTEFITRWGIDPNNFIRVKSMFVDDIQMKLSEWINADMSKLAIAVDSIGALELKKMLKDSEGEGEGKRIKADQGRLQKEIKRMMKLIVSLTKFNDCISFSSGHYYGNPTGYGDAEKIGGGNYWKLACDVIVTLKKSPKYEFPEKKPMKERGRILGNDITAMTFKNRFYPPFQEATLSINYKEGIDEMAGLIDLARELGIVNVSGSWYSFQDIKEQGEIKFNNALMSKKEVFLKTLEENLQKTGYSNINDVIKTEYELEGKIEETEEITKEDE